MLSFIHSSSLFMKKMKFKASENMKLLLFFILLLHFQSSVTAEDQIVTICGSSNYTSDSIYEANLNTILSNLSTNGVTMRQSFYNTSYGEEPNKIYGFSQCMSAASEDVCRQCLVNSTADIIRRCPNKTAASVRYYNCIMRYSDQRFFSQLDTAMRVYVLPLANVPNTSVEIFNTQLGGLMDGLSSAAALATSKYAVNKTSYTNFQKIHGLAQCTRDLSLTNCKSCLDSMISYIPECCNQGTGGSVYSISCNIRYETYSFFDISPSPPPPPMDTSPTPTIESPDMKPPQGTSDSGSHSKSSRTIIVIVVPIVAIFGLFFIAVACFIWRRKPKKKSSDEDQISSVESQQFSLDTIKVATNNFSDENKLGQGGFGSVYRGTLPNGQEIAVKRLSSASNQGVPEFKNEVQLVAKLQHRNLVRLLGCCAEGEEKILIYEFLPNTSLDNFLFDPSKKTYLTWERRYKIIGGIARGLLYLHEDSRLKIIHRDLKASNILLDDDMNPKISDFGMARLFGVDQTQGSTNIIAGTYGYMAPEYAMNGRFSVKSDVFSFGVLLLEIISGRKNSNFDQSDGGTNLLSYAWRLWKDGTPLELVDPTLGESFSRNEVMRCIHIGLLCVQEDVAERPFMSSVVLMLSSFSVTLPTSLPPPFFMRGRSEFSRNVLLSNSRASESENSASNATPMSANEVSITELDPR